MSRAAETLSQLPLATLSVMALCIAVFGFQLLLDPPLEQFTMCPRQVIYHHQVYRVITSTLFHGSFMHIAMNMMSTYVIGTSLERQIGTLTMSLTIILGMIFTGIVKISISLILASWGLEVMMMRHSLGFSGVIFQLLVLDCNLRPDRSEKLFGLMTVPSKAYPWVKLVGTQFILPNVSFLGHLSGILVGTLQYHGFLRAFFPREGVLQKLETDERFSALRKQSNFAATPDSVGLDGSDASGLFAAAALGVRSLIQLLAHLYEAIRVIVFGRGADAKADDQLTAPNDEDVVDEEYAWGSSGTRLGTV